MEVSGDQIGGDVVAHLVFDVVAHLALMQIATTNEPKVRNHITPNLIPRNLHTKTAQNHTAGIALNSAPNTNPSTNIYQYKDQYLTTIPLMNTKRSQNTDAKNEIIGHIFYYMTSGIEPIYYP
jgi:hypothetical protein